MGTGCPRDALGLQVPATGALGLCPGEFALHVLYPALSDGDRAIAAFRGGGTFASRLNHPDRRADPGGAGAGRGVRRGAMMHQAGRSPSYRGDARGLCRGKR